MPPDYLQIQARPPPEIYDRFQPSDIPGLGLDLDARYGVLTSISPDVPAANGDPVRRWMDKSGNARDYDQPIATSQPKLMNSDGMDRINFDGINDYLSSGSTDLTRNVDGVTIFYVGNLKSIPATNKFMFSISRNTNGDRASLSVISTSKFRAAGRRLDTDSFQSISGGVLAVEPVIFAGKFDYQNANLEIYKNGISTGVLNPFQTVGKTSDTNSLNSYIAASVVDPVSGFIDMDCKRVLVWPRALSAPELAAVHAYLSQTYGIPLA